MGLLSHLKYAKFSKRILSNKGKTPLYLIFFVTSKCNLKCAHCFYWKGLNQIKDDLTLEEISRIAENMDPLMLLRLTGGEPTLRKDLADIVKIFYNKNGVRNIGINTNGFLTQKIVSDINKILKECKDIILEVCVSLDDSEIQHDENRGVSTSYKKAVETIKSLKEIKKEYKNLRLAVTITVTNKNQDRLDEIFEKDFLPLGPDFISVNLVRGLPKDPKLKDVNLEKYIKFINKIRSYNNRKSHELYINSSLKDKLMSKYIVNSIEQKKFQGMYCLAGDKVGVIYSNGDVFPCELLNKQIGNIKEHNYNFKELWNSEKGKHVRRFIKVTQCFCTHECFLTANLLLNPRNLVRYIKEYIFSMIRSPDVTKKKSEIEHPAKLKAGVN